MNQYQWTHLHFKNVNLHFKTLKLILKRNFNTAHSTSSSRNNFLFKVSLQGRPELGFGQCGLPPKKPLCYLSDLQDCQQFVKELMALLSHREKDLFQLSNSELQNQIFKNIPSEYFSFRVQKEIRNKQIRQLLIILYVLNQLRIGKFKAPISALQFSIFDLLAQIYQVSLPKFIFSSQKQNICYSFYTLSYEDPQEMIQNCKSGLQFTSFIKIKFVDKIKELLQFLHLLQKHTQNRIKGYIIDANASWSISSFNHFNAAIKEQKNAQIFQKIIYIEQPFPVQMSFQEMKQWQQAKKSSVVKIISDESFSDYNQIELAKKLSHGVNIKAEKAGGLVNSLRTAIMCKQSQLQIMFGTMVSTHLGCTQTYCLHHLTQLLDVDGSLLVDQPVVSGGFQWAGKDPLKPPKSDLYGLGVDVSKL